MATAQGCHLLGLSLAPGSSAPWGRPPGWHGRLHHRNPGRLGPGAAAPLEPSLEPLPAGVQKPRGWPVFVGAAVLKPTPRLGSFPRAWRLKHLQGHLSGVSAGRLRHWRWARGAMVMLHALRVTQPVILPPCLPGSAPRDLPLTSPRAVSLFSSTVSSRSHPGVAPPSPHSSSLPPPLPGPVLGPQS